MLTLSTDHPDSQLRDRFARLAKRMDVGSQANDQLDLVGLMTQLARLLSLFLRVQISITLFVPCVRIDHPQRPFVCSYPHIIQPVLYRPPSTNTNRMITLPCIHAETATLYAGPSFFHSSPRGRQHTRQNRQTLRKRRG